ncbi:MAG: carbohydrate porin [Acidisphaera sp.]|nr:carbohydrate porin [Acidisphaera sp.]
MGIIRHRRRPGVHACLRLLWLCLPLACLPGHASAQAPLPGAPAERQSPTPGPAANPPTPAAAPGEGFWVRSTLLGDMAGLRTALGEYGISLGLQETSEVLANISGGGRRGLAYNGLTMMSLGLDTKALGWAGGTVNISALQIHGRSLSADNLGVIQAASGIEAKRATRLWELWYQQAILPGTLDVKLGQQSIDQEFSVSQYSAVLFNAAAGWPALPSADLYAGGPTYPLSSLGVRVRAQPTGALTLLGGVFDDNPPGGRFADDSQLRGAERSGTRFNIGTGALFIAEIQYTANQPAEGGAPAGLPGTYKLGAWFDTGAFADQRFDANGLSLADPRSSGAARMRRGDFSVYGLVDQMVWRPDAQSARVLGVFARAMGAPADRNLVSASLDAGAVLKAPLPGRDNDSFAVGYGIAKVSGRAAAADRDVAAFSRSAYPVRSSESFIEVTYQYQIAPWWQVQPDFQYVFMPSGGIADPLSPGRRIGNTAIFGLRTNVVF